jgi:UDP-GlcNAc:undecaprenyl-phosphate GlcNAc-1-phosphate transferase
MGHLTDLDIRFLCSFVVALCLSLLFIPQLIRHSYRLGLVDDPTGNERKHHGVVMPRSGSLGIILAAGIASMLVLPLDYSLLTFVLAATVITLFGLIDDRLGLGAGYKFLGQMLGVAIAMAGGMVIHDVPFYENAPAWFCYLLTFIFVVGIVNAVNFSDGMDGLAAGITIMALLLIFILAVQSNNTPVAAIALCLSGSLLGFLRFNTHPASIYMGDAGSQFLGFVVAWLGIYVSQSDLSPMTTLMPLLLLGIPAMDMVQVIPLRLWRGSTPWTPDRQNFHHQISNLGFLQYEVVAIIYTMQALLLTGAYSLRFSNDYIVLGFYLAFAGLNLGVIYLGNINNWHIRKARLPGQHYSRSRFFRPLGSLHSYTTHFFGLMITGFFIFSAVLSYALIPSLVVLSLLWAVVLLAIIIFSHNRWPMALGRLASYSVAGVMVYGLTCSFDNATGNLLINVTLLLLLLLMTLAIRITRREYFGLTTQDLLVVIFLVILTLQFVVDSDLTLPVGIFIFRILALQYMCEFVLARGDTASLWLALASIFSLAFLGIHL